MSKRACLALAWLTLSGCVSRPGDFGSSATEAGDPTGDTGDGSTAPAPGTTTTTTTTTTTSPTTGPGDDPVVTATSAGSDPSGTDGDTVDFINPPDGGPVGKECDQWVQDCPEGQKCNAYSGDGDLAWESLKCVDVVPDPDGLYEPCEVFGSHVSGEDSCDVGLMCWDVVDGKGTCIAYCTGSPDQPGCPDPESSCILTAEGVITLCLPSCDPLQQDCDGGDLCIPNPGDPHAFICVLDASGDEGQVFDPCDYANECDAGLYCMGTTLAEECDPQSSGCCLPFCATSLPNTCPGQGQECLPWWGEDPPEPGLENLGVCGLPQ
ncbi:hypothetical protein SAMN02745121_03135 [Nannocystis exedens]|uniref:Uncharacterized protein n=1 Tax=Nannocystis exedens TaxID=54 RepID=A0A1I1Y3A6_9BACT|nr:hypothetical protein [Nannocystis exedens]PCC71783.1 hypothetical protein NAEX_04862 [Nannocystis exedens]SFE14031.1 hypothetical protein SAMN02745121_03135 [Nannocystis exedens]